MAFSTDTSVNFNSGTGYVFDPGAVEFVTVGPDSGARLITSFVGSSTILCPSISTGAWTGAILKVAIDSRDAVSGTSVYFTRFAVSFDGGTTFMIFESGEWRVAYVTDVPMTRQQIEEVRVWPPLDQISGLVFVVVIGRENATGANGLINLITVTYGSGTVALDAGEPAFSGTILQATSNDTAYRMPSVVPSAEIDRPADLHASIGGYKQGVNRSSVDRRLYRGIEWRFVTETQREWILGFIEDHLAASFQWSPPGRSAAKWIVLEPCSANREDADSAGGGSGLYHVRADFLEVFPS